MRFLKNKKILVIMGVILLLGVCLGIDFLISNFTSDEIWTGESDIDITEDNENMEEIDENNENIDGTEKDVTDDFSDLESLDNSSNSESSGNSGGSGESNNVKEANGESSIESNDNNIYVYVTGEVNNQGVVVLKEGSRITDAIDAAGGVTGNANITKINLVFILEDGMKVNIPSNNQLKDNPDFEYITMGSGDGDVNSWTSASSNSSNSSGSANSKNSYSGQIQIVNINTASQTELETLPGIGPSIALRIINYREENGRFSCIEDIKNVSGIGDSKFDDIKNYITV